MADKEELEEFRRRLTPEERRAGHAFQGGDAYRYAYRNSSAGPGPLERERIERERERDRKERLNWRY